RLEPPGCAALSSADSLQLMIQRTDSKTFRGVVPADPPSHRYGCVWTGCCPSHGKEVMSLRKINASTRLAWFQGVAWAGVRDPPGRDAAFWPFTGTLGLIVNCRCCRR